MKNWESESGLERSSQIVRKILKTDRSSQGIGIDDRLNSKKCFSSNPSRIKSFSELISSCEYLQKDINIVSSNIHKDIKDSRVGADIERFLKREIRDSQYLNQAKVIEDRIAKQKAKSLPKELKKLKTVIFNDRETTVTPINSKDVTSCKAKYFLQLNRRGFGKHFSDAPAIAVSSSRIKLKEIKVDPKETIIQDLLSGNSNKSQSRNSTIFPSQSPKKRPKFPSISLAMSTKATSKKLFSERKKVRKL